MSVVKTTDLGISSTEYRETTSPATEYHSPSNWLVTTPSSTAESDTVKPMLAPSTTVGKDKTSLHPSNTMLIKKSTSTDMRLESTDYKLSGQITSSYKTESQQTTAIPEILSPGEQCGTSLLTWERGILHSPNFPRHYPNGQLCSWNIIVKSTQRIHLIFTHFDLQEDKDTDSVIVYDGIDQTGKILGVFYGGKLPSKEGIVSSSNNLSVIFQTDKSGSGTGFRATYSAVRIRAGKSSSIVVTSSWPQTSLLLRPEPTSSSMSVVKTADHGSSSSEYRETTSPATVYHSPSNWLVTTPSSTAESDTVTPMLALSTTTAKDKTSLHPSNTMLIKKSTSTAMRLESTDYKLSGLITSSYKTESQQTTAFPEILSPECGTSLLTWERGILHSPNFPRHYPNGQLCSWNIIVKSTQRIHLIFTHFDLQEDKDTDSVIVYDGIDETGKILGVFYGGKLPSEEGIVSSSNTLSVIFQTDKSGSGTGFRATYSAVRIVGKCQVLAMLVRE
ncbi:PREDICTED: deleted in malignant brain tumors 1 protein-like isoform X3 [Acropora digitifera]|uniref:deleted in malignant brain tumors 1 protein-like isoform X3 n=1 Tax=Acropora digitifera TaxID=70779 RepID=UPI00077AB0DE|nr:PREDICTED: deleted in malignant brain tumors 1 protein-like isoform X3 [Acropora digitifera]